MIDSPYSLLVKLERLKEAEILLLSNRESGLIACNGSNGDVAFQDIWFSSICRRDIFGIRHIGCGIAATAFCARARLVNVLGGIECSEEENLRCSRMCHSSPLAHPSRPLQSERYQRQSISLPNATSAKVTEALISLRTSPHGNHRVGFEFHTPQSTFTSLHLT